MKAKLKGANGFVRFLLQHGEKVGIAAILAVAGMLIWSSLGRPVVDNTKQPEPLKMAAQKASSHVAEMSWEAFSEPDRTDSAKFIAGSGDRTAAPVNPPNYPEIKPLNPQVIAPIKLRQDPVLVTAEDLEVRPGAGLWMSSNPEAIKKNMLAAMQEAARLNQEAAEEAERMAEEAEGEGGRGRGQGRGPGGMGYGEGGRGGMGEMGGMKTKDGVLVIPPTGGAPMQGFEDILEQSWVTVLAKVPIKQQVQMYEDALATARGFNVTADLPEYIGYEVQRAEVTDEGPGEFKTIKQVIPKTVIKTMSTWPIQTPDLVNPKYIHPLLTHPLPPMVMREWGEEITHTDLPLPTPEDLMGGAELEGTPPPAKEEEGDPNDVFGSAARRQTPPGGAMAGGYGGRGGEMGRGGMPGGYGGRGGEMGRGGMPGGYGGRGGEMGRGGGYGGRGGEMGRGGMSMGGGMGPAIEELPPYAWDGLTKTILFRFIDDTVVPGHRYRYRVALALKDVNVDQPAKYLDPTVTARQTQSKKPARHRMTEWSEPSPVAVVPSPGLTFIAQTKEVGSLDPEARLIIKSVDSSHAAEIAIDNWFTRGSVLNFAQKAKIIWSTLYKIDPEKPEDSPDFKFLTGLMLVDLEGGDQLVSKNRNLTAPARALVMDSSGRLMMQNELAQAKTIKQYDFIMKQDAEAARRARETEGGERGGGPGGRGGGRGGRGGF
ncbi:MAG: hypothetical protein C0485_14235 [Pirellula sp.]|nr:hypothetical protein [Pirellula sp.]